MSCEIRSMMTSYFFGSSMRMPPIFTNSAVTPSTFIELIFSTTAGGKVFSMPNKIPIFFITHSVETLLATSSVHGRKRRSKLRLYENQKYFTAILSHSGQSCLELSFQTSNQWG